ncbi:MAG: hypothetical protein JWQ34_3160 [Mucilaginibacter sp.]|uniref:putative phage abortive infection protein n=1 Tax=Mucilaginibacter sp. TaxID=1882438 RepID=UPI00261224F3|nr:putative phage abortive infection protein [Mucilaginibacter sp.]MDB5004935.1 hypothetical protein [Mucilaginibacter sp.]
MKVKDTYAFWLIGLGASSFITLLILFLWKDSTVFSTSTTIDHSKLSSLGSIMSGLVGTFWSLAGVLLFYIALTEQRKDMEVNRKALGLQTDALTNQIKEFELQTAELQASREVYTEQLATQSLQRFESTFFQMVTLHHNLVNSAAARDERGNAIAVGRESFIAINGWLIKRWNPLKNLAEEDIISTYLSLYDSYQHVLGHYFRNLYHIFKFIDESSISNKKLYANIIRAQLSSNELLLLVYNCLSTNGDEKFKPLVEKYSVLKNLDWTLIEGGMDVIRRYKAKAFGHKDFSFLDGHKDWL